MPKLPISDLLGLEFDGRLKRGAGLLQAFPLFARIGSLPLDEAPVDEAGAAWSFPRSVPIPGAGIPLKIEGGTGAKVSLIRPERRNIEAGDAFDGIPLARNEIWLAVEFRISAGSEASAAGGHFSAGFASGGVVSLARYRRFARGAEGFPPFSIALARTLAGFTLPGDASDLLEIDSDSIVTLSGSGTLTLSGDFALSMPVETLASVSRAGRQLLQVNSVASVKLGARLGLEGEYEVRLRGLDGGLVELGVYRLRSRKLQVDLTAQAGLPVRSLGFDVTERLIGALSSRPAVELDAFRRAVPGEDDATQARIESFERALKGAISTKLQASLSATLAGVKSSEALWMFRIDPATAESEHARTAILRALAGDFSALTEPGSRAEGIEQVVNILTETESTRRSLRVNLLGLVNIMSVAAIARTSVVERNDSGDITLITDTASASRLHALLQNKRGDARRLRKLLSENFLIEAAYRVANVGVLPPEFRSRHTHFTIEERTSRRKMKDILDVCRVLGLITPDQLQARLGTRKDFGAVSLYVELSYANSPIRSVFLDGASRPRPREEYETLGRSALNALLSGDQEQDLRRRYADLGLSGTELWNRMKEVGNTAQFGPLFNLPVRAGKPQLAAAGVDYLAITGWAEAMHSAAVAVHEALDATAGDDAGPGSAEARERLKSRLTDVVRKTHDQFGDPLGLLMVYLAAGQDARKRVRLSGERIEALESGDEGAAPASAGQ